MPEFLIQNVWQPLLWIYSLFAWPTDIITWHFRNFLTKCHNTSNETLENDSVTSFNPLADILLWIGTLVIANDDDLYDKCLVILEFHRQVTLTSRAITCVTAAMQNNVQKPQGSAFIYVNKLPCPTCVLCCLHVVQIVWVNGWILVNLFVLYLAHFTTCLSRLDGSWWFS